MITTKQTISLFILAGMLLFTGCEKFVEIEPPPNQLSSSTVFTDENSANAAVSAIYASMSTGILSANMQFAMEYYSGILTYNGTTDNYMQFMNKSMQVDNSLISSFWNGLYQYIYYCNSAIVALRNSDLSQDVQDNLLAECLFIRAFCYSYLVNNWGSVPLILTTDWDVNQSMGRTDENLIYEQIIADLEEAKMLFDPGVPGPVNTRANYYTVVALLSRIYYFLENWNMVEENTSILLSNTAFTLSEIADVFLINSREAIFQLTSIDPTILNTNIGQQIIPWSANAVPNIGISMDLLSGFSDTDTRINHWTAHNTVRNVEYYYPLKYKEGLFSNEKKENLVVLRLAEQYFYRSIARLELGHTAEALHDLNTVLARSQQSYTSITRETILQELQKEFFAEWGIANNDPVKKWPIPLSQIETNPSLNQNDGY